MPDALWTSAEISEATGGQATADFEVGGVSIDSRELRPGDLFVALTDVRDGHDFVEAAFKAGAAGALVSRPVEGGPYVLVEDVLEALTALGLAARKRARDCYRVAVTGSVGKTSVKEMIALIFRSAGKAHWSERSFNNQWGVPLSLARMPSDTEFAVFEIGMSTPGEIAPRSRMVAPHAALITKIAPAHLEGVGSIEGVAREKSDIFAGLLPEGHVLLPEDDRFRDFLAERAEAHQAESTLSTFGRGHGAAVRVTSYASHGTRSEIGLSAFGGDVDVSVGAVGRHWADNAAAALLAACIGSKIDVKDAARALETYVPPPGRGTTERLYLPDGGSITLIDDAYNANPESMRAALAAFAERACQGRRLLGLGEMLEIGEGALAEHAALAESVRAVEPALVLLAGQNMKALVDELGERTESIWAVKADDLVSHMKVNLKDGDMLLLKGSNASGMGKLAGKLRQWSEVSKQDNKKGSAERAVTGDNAI